MLNPPSHDVSIRDDAEKRCKITAFRRICQTFARFSCPFGKIWGVSMCCGVSYGRWPITFCYFPGNLTHCHLKASEIHLYGAGGGGGRKKRSFAECAETKMSANGGRRLSFCRGCGCFRAGITGARKPGGACADILTPGICR